MAKVIYLDDYRRLRLSRQKSLRAMIEGHLAEAGLLDERQYICGENKFDICQILEECWEPWEAEIGVEPAEK